MNNLAEDDITRSLVTQLALQTALDSRLAPLWDRAKKYAATSYSKSTLTSYLGSWVVFDRWCSSHGLTPLPADSNTIALFVTELSNTVKMSTIRLRMAGIAAVHRLGGFDPPPTDTEIVRRVLRGIVREKGAVQTSKEPILLEELETIIAALPVNVAGARDRALLLMGWIGAFRRSELAALLVSDLTRAKDRVVVLVRNSKTDKSGEGQLKVLTLGQREEMCPIRALDRWLGMGGIVEGFIFRMVDRNDCVRAHGLTGAAVANIVRRSVARVHEVKGYSGHSLRHGFVTEGVLREIPPEIIMAQTGHKSAAMLLRYADQRRLRKAEYSRKWGL